MTRLYGRAPQGKRLVDKVPHGHWKTTTFICGLRYDGVTAPFVLDGPMDGPHFLAYVEQILAPTLKKGQIVFLDNVSTHKVDGVEEAIEARGARAVFLPESNLLFSQKCKVFPKKNATLISRTRDTPNLIEKCARRFGSVSCGRCLTHQGRSTGFAGMGRLRRSSIKFMYFRCVSQSVR